MQFSLETRTASLSVGEFSDFALGPREAGAGGAPGLWRAQLGQHWHQELRTRTLTGAPDARFEIPVEGRLVHRGWTLTLAGRIDQLVGATLREIKTVTDPLPADEAALRTDYGSYFRQLAAYVVLLRTSGSSAVAGHPSLPPLRGELVFVEASSGLSQSVALTPFDEALVHHQLDAIVEFLDQRRRAAAHRHALRFRPPFRELRPGQETIQQDLNFVFGLPPAGPQSQVEIRQSKILLLEAPTGYGKTGVVLEFALGQLRAGRFNRLVWLTGKSTGQLQVVRTLGQMTADSALSVWQVRNKREHCVNEVFHCVRDACGFLAGCAERWPQSGLARFHLDDQQPRDLETLRAAGRAAHICPYEITRAALPFNDVWIGDYNYVFAPDNRGLFFEQPGFVARETLLVIDEAHNLPSRAADAYSHAVSAADAGGALPGLYRAHAPSSLLLSWEGWSRFLGRLKPCEALAPDLEAELRDALDTLANQVSTLHLDHAALGPHISELLWQGVALRAWLDESTFPKLLWCPRAGELCFTCLDAAAPIGETLRSFGGAILMSATLSPSSYVTAGCGLDQPPASPPAVAELPADDRLGRLNKRQTRTLYRQLTSGAELLRVEEARAAGEAAFLRAPAPWRDGAYDVAVDVRVDTSLRHRASHYGTTATTIEALHAAACSAVERRKSNLENQSEAASSEPSNFDPGLSPQNAAIAVFFPSYAYAEAVLRASENSGSALRVALQPKLPDLAAQAAWVEESLALADALFLVLGSSFAEGIDLFGGRVTHAMVVGPALPEVNAVQKARLDALGSLGREAAFRRVYQIPGLQKVNQALGRLVRAPGQRAKVLLHCRRFAETSYASLLASEYQFGREIASDADLAAWLAHDRGAGPEM
jgi:DNA excision repair protein ERCC-2